MIRQVIGKTESLCPECLAVIPAHKSMEDGDVYLEKICPRHGFFKTIIWRGARTYCGWGEFGQELGGPGKRLTMKERGCPYDCGLCSEHKAETCFAIIEVTQRCNLSCRICFASVSGRLIPDPSAETIKEMYELILNTVGEECSLQLSGGEPTLRDDLPLLIGTARKMGFRHIQVNTNGLRIARDLTYLQSLEEEGVSVIYLQFDGVTEEVYRDIRGRSLLSAKTEAMANCAHVGVGVILVPTLVPGINFHQVGDLVRLAKKWVPVVKGIHFQPVSYFGRYPFMPQDKDRITLPEVLIALEEQTAGEVRLENFVPRRRKESYCAFGGFFILTEQNRLVAVTDFKERQNLAGEMGQPKGEPHKQVRRFVTEKWRFVKGEEESRTRPGSMGSLFERAKTHYLSISSMPFQDVWNVDLERVKRCCTHVVAPSGRIVPLCAYYVTDVYGRRLISLQSLLKVENVPSRVD